jgi:hypothetical protein
MQCTPTAAFAHLARQWGIVRLRRRAIRLRRRAIRLRTAAKRNSRQEPGGGGGADEDAVDEVEPGKVRERRAPREAPYFAAAILFRSASTLSPYADLSACLAKLRYLVASAFLPAAKKFTPRA